MNNNKVKAAARQALITADKSYYSWPPQQQEKFRASMNETAQNKVDSILLNSLLDFKSTPENADEIWSELPLNKATGSDLHNTLFTFPFMP